MRKALVLLAVAMAVMMFAGCATTEEASAGSNAAAAVPAASGSSLSFWNFETKSTEGWAGKGKWAEALTVNDDVKFVKEGKYSMKIAAKGSKGYNQDIAVNDGPFSDQFGKLKAITMDVYVPAESIKGLEYAQIFLVVNGSANSWYQIPQGLKAGWNSLKFALESDNIDGDIWHLFLVLNSGAAFAGPIYVDNIQGVL